MKWSKLRNARYSDCDSWVIYPNRNSWQIEPNCHEAVKLSEELPSLHYRTLREAQAAVYDAVEGEDERLRALEVLEELRQLR